MIYPLDTNDLTQRFAENPQVYKQFGMAGHNGIDFRTCFLANGFTGNMPCSSVMDGVVLETGDQGKKGYGKFVRVRHAGTSQTIYGHFSAILVEKGDHVAQGDRIGITGNTGFSTGPHLHFGYRPDGWEQNYDNGFKGYIDPLPFLEKRSVIKQEPIEPDFAKTWAGWLIIVPEAGGEVWYVNPKNLKRYKLSGGVKSADAALLARDGAWIGMKLVDLLKIPQA